MVALKPGFVHFHTFLVSTSKLLCVPSTARFHDFGKLVELIIIIIR